MTGASRVMLGGMGDNPVAFCVPITLTIILLTKHRVSFNNRKLLFTIGLIAFWAIIQIIVKHQYTTKSFANYLYYMYAIIIAYIHIGVYQRKLFHLYEDVMVKLSLLSLIIWTFTNIMPGLAIQIASFFPKTTHGNNFLFLVHWISPLGKHVEYGLTRNAGSSWEPGRFAIMVCLAILFNIYREGVCFKGNKNVIILIVALLTTMSTTGYVMVFLIYTYMYIKKWNAKYLISIILISIPLIYVGINLNFVGKKLEKKLDVNTTVEHIEDSYAWSEQNADGTLAFSMDRFPSMVFEFENFFHDPIIGYGANLTDSYFMRTRTDKIGFTGGLVTLLSKYGIFMAIFFLYVLYMSSLSTSSVFHSNKKYGLMLCFVLSMISYPLIWFPVYTAFWFYGFFLYDKKKY